MFVKPRDREVVCHASAWNVNNVDDLRIKMCIDQTAEDFSTIHHVLGHNYYQRAYNRLPMVFRDSANDGFHEALGDVLALSVTPEYLVKIGLLDTAPDASADTGLLLRTAMERLAFLPFGLLVDQWRWQVEQFFDPGATPSAKAQLPRPNFKVQTSNFPMAITWSAAAPSADRHAHSPPRAAHPHGYRPRPNRRAVAPRTASARSPSRRRRAARPPAARARLPPCSGPPGR
jgi:hypothetical protein